MWPHVPSACSPFVHVRSRLDPQSNAERAAARKYETTLRDAGVTDEFVRAKSGQLTDGQAGVSFELHDDYELSDADRASVTRHDGTNEFGSCAPLR